MHLKETESLPCGDVYTVVFTAALFSTAEARKQQKSVSRGIGKEMWCIHTMAYVFSLKTKGNSATCDNIDKPVEDQAK